MARGLVLSVTLLAGCASVSPVGGEPSAGSSVVATAAAVVTAAATATATASLSPSSQAPAATAFLPSPAPTVDPAMIQLDTTSCEGGVVLDWSASSAPEFHHYSALRSPERDIAPDWPPIAPAVDWGDTYTTDRFVTSAADDTVTLSDRTWFYRVMAYDVENRVVGSSPVQSARMDPVADLGAVTATPPGEEGQGRVGWEPYTGFSECFSSYRVTVTSAGASPAVLAVISEQTAGEVVTRALHPGTTVTISVEAVRTTILGSFTIGEAEPLVYAVP